ncbi:hypothetical protein TSOC_004627 [Tetrabaena socialis]|uniref:Uncharacterized protein n=1 Tax=Tetrabaena socialis TaxID=47790 RepID=A0A2J8A8F7_9CHLO|nr:hypothetical protein TSOC_004627 [Tetrabaena socialis]|eukprot:PNH08798.1 hypothetical protein TSOC_004627 [Tetrabaena socialis]
MAGSARNLQGLVRRALGQSGVRGFATEPKTFMPDGRYSPGIFSKAKPVDRSYEWVAKNPYIEAWYYKRDNFEKQFVWDFRSTVEALWMLGGFTAGFYYLSVFAMRQADRRSGYPRRAILGDEPGVVLVDERDFY